MPAQQSSDHLDATPAAPESLCFPIGLSYGGVAQIEAQTHHLSSSNGVRNLGSIPARVSHWRFRDGWMNGICVWSLGDFSSLKKVVSYEARFCCEIPPPSGQRHRG